MKKIFTVIICAFLCSGIFAAGKISEQRQNFISYSLKLQGIPYVWGGYEPKGFDCSGFVYYAARESVKYQLPRTSVAIYGKCKKIDAKDKEPGDLVFFANSSGKINHVGIYCGVYHNKTNPNTRFEGQRVFISAISDGPRTGVQLELMDAKYWKNHLYGYGRFLPSTEEYNKAHGIQ